MSLVGKHESPLLSTLPSISQEDIAPILNSIVSEDGCSLTYLFYPQKFLDCRPEPAMVQFLDAFDTHLENYVSCARPNESPRCEWSIDIMRNQRRWWYSAWDDHLCGGCNRYFCYRCQEDEQWEMIFCSHCRKYFCAECDTSGEETCQRCQIEFCPRRRCKECGEMDICPKCSKRYCSEEAFFCDYCDEPCCEDCTWNSCPSSQHPRCKRGLCVPCAEGGNTNDPDGTPDVCKECGTYFCKKHKYLKCSENWADACRGCVEMIIPANIASNNLFGKL